MAPRNDESEPGETPRRTLAVVLLVVAIDMVGFGILVPVIPLYALSFGATEFVASLLIAAYSLMQFLSAPVLGRLSDERGRRPVLLLSLAGMYTGIAFWMPFVVAGLLVLPIVILLRRFGSSRGPERTEAIQQVATSQRDERRVR